MGVVSFFQELESPIAPGRLFKAVILDAHNLLPRVMPDSVLSIDTVEGDGGVGSIRQTNFCCGVHIGYVKLRVDELDEENYECKYTMIEGDVLGEKLESIAYELKFEAIEDGGCIRKMESKYYTVQDVELKEEDIEFGKEKAVEMYKFVEAYLLANPLAYT